MVPTLLVGDYLFVSKFSYGYSRYSLPFGLPLFSGPHLRSRPPQRGDVASSSCRRDPSTDYIKRVIGLPGDQIQMKDGILYINGQPVQRERNGRLTIDRRARRRAPILLSAIHRDACPTASSHTHPRASATTGRSTTRGSSTCRPATIS